ncbi:glycoside hydrolase [Metschnikowia bicuspidata var. bicuspidata NRRL YB-4993]|uniref:Glycoside hydrolase n=1 Tax=Metschnikowia bicuspidata var. bicuspidata NRRL YB-4993 TaxID=869754 RepID=A0A1A0H4H7_9ASCO|nr:glycoside hydrolase [Metschnikowia bicuspidata var. bicuspidata NRRL YB-4993]OBA18979.1 glycoside hydrolase [Metschnikowia bicuspidata var. bicuspidata NRRL YB-4993]
MGSIFQAFASARSAKEAISDRISLYRAVPGISVNGVRSLKKKHNAGETIPTVEQSGSSILECQPLHIENGDIVDTQGRKRMLKGLNVDSSMKLPMEPFMPSYEGESSESKNIFFDGDNVSFVGRPFSLETAESHLERIKSLGYNTIRYLISWEALEHEGPGIYDKDFIDYTIKVLRIIYKVGGLYVFLEPHQDVWSRYCGGSGAPMWTLYAAGLQPERFSACEAAILHNSDKFEYCTRNDLQSYPKMLWTSNYKRLALLTMFTLFFSGATYFPHLKLNGTNIQHYLQYHHLESLKHLWVAVVEQLPEMFENGSILGFELLNEPNCGLVGTPNLSIIPSSQHLRIGSTPTALDCFKLGMGLPVEVDDFRIAITGPHIDGRVVVDPKGQRAWLSAEEMATIDAKYGWTRSGWAPGVCIYASAGIWAWKDIDLEKLKLSPQSSRLAFTEESCKILKPFYFSEVSSEISFDVPKESLPALIDQGFFTNHFFVEYYAKFKDMVRSVAPSAFVFIQPPVLEEPPRLKDDPRKIIDDRTIYCPHYYDGMSLMFKSWNFRYNVDTLGIMRGRYLNPVLGIVLGERAIRNCLKKQFREIKEEGLRLLGPVPVLMSETGMPFDMDDKKAFDDGRYQMQTAALDALANALEGANMHHTYWCYNSINCHKWGDRWNNEDFSFWSPDDRDLSFDILEEEKSLASSYRSDSITSTRKDSVTPSLRSIRIMKENSGTTEVLKTKLSYHKKRLIPSLFKSPIINDLHDEYADPKSGSVEESSLISTSSDNIRYRHYKQCYPSPDGIRAVSAVMRPFVVATLGTIKESEFDIKLSKFALTLSLDERLSVDELKTSPTLIFTPKWHYPYLNYNDIYLNAGFVKYDDINEYLEWYHYDDESDTKKFLDIYQHTIIIKNHSGTLEDPSPCDDSVGSNECPLV